MTIELSEDEKLLERLNCLGRRKKVLLQNILMKRRSCQQKRVKLQNLRGLIRKKQMDISEKYQKLEELAEDGNLDKEIEEVANTFSHL